MRKIIVAAVLFLLPALPVRAQDCGVENRACVLDLIQADAALITEKSWRDQTYRELAKTRAFEGDIDAAITLIPKIETPDTQAMTIRGIGMAVADIHLPKDKQDEAFVKLRAAAEKITHPPSYAIALTYIAMSQAFAGDNQNSWKTASEMKNDALRHKAYGETAEIQAEKGDFTAAMKSIELIESAAYRNKAYAMISKILADRKMLKEAFEAAKVIDNPYKRATAFQHVLDIQKPREVEK